MKSNIWKFVLVSLGLIVFAAVLFLYRPVSNLLNLPALNAFTRVTVTGDSEADLAPDNAIVTFSIVTQNKQSSAAQSENARKSQAAISAINEVGAGFKQEVKTSNYSLTPEQEYQESGPPKIVGYEARNTLIVTTENLDQVGALIDAATAAGANSVEGIQFVLRQDSTKRGDALGLATKQARAKADAIAASLGGRVVRIVETVEGGATTSQTQPIFPSGMPAANAVANMARTQIVAAPIKMRGQVTLVVDIEALRGN